MNDCLFIQLIDKTKRLSIPDDCVFHYSVSLSAPKIYNGF